MTASETRVDGRRLRYQHCRPQLLSAVTEYLLDHGMNDLSLRELARGVGVTHATLLRHFSTKEVLLWEVIAKVRADFAAALAKVDAAHSTDPVSDVIRATWDRLCEPLQQRQFALLFELTGRAARERGRLSHLAQAAIDDWLSLLTPQLLRSGCSPADADTRATLLLAQVRGLQLDLLLTGDRSRADRAIDALLAMFNGTPPSDPPGHYGYTRHQPHSNTVKEI